jgi:hypothetical protein
MKAVCVVSIYPVVVYSSPPSARGSSMPSTSAASGIGLGHTMPHDNATNPFDLEISAVLEIPEAFQTEMEEFRA